MSQFRVLIFLVLVNFCMLLSAIVMGYKLVLFYGLSLPASVYVLPISYMCNDIIAELYGYRMSRSVIWTTFTCLFIFSMLIVLLLRLPPVHYWHQQIVYEQALGGTFRLTIATIIGLLVGDFINAYLLTQWKAMLHGRIFWLRSLGSTAVGDLVATVLVFSIAFIGVLPWQTYLEMIWLTYVIKLIFNVVVVIPTSVLVTFLKTAWLNDVPSHGLTFNPFAEYKQPNAGIPVEFEAGEEMPAEREAISFVVNDRFIHSE